MNTRIGPRQLAQDLCSRSPCHIKMAAVLADNHGIFSWGWSSPGPDGMGLHAESHALTRANRRRVPGSTITVAGWSGKKWLLSRPCTERCLPLIIARGVGKVEWMGRNGRWVEWRL